eukprot:7785364-Heterocapsa_arctica.AAC.1
MEGSVITHQVFEDVDGSGTTLITTELGSAGPGSGESITHQVFEDYDGSGTTLVTTNLGSAGPGDGEDMAAGDVEMPDAESEASEEEDNQGATPARDKLR